MQIKGVAQHVRSELAAEENRSAGGNTLSTFRLPQLSDEDVRDSMLLVLLNEVRQKSHGTKLFDKPHTVPLPTITDGLLLFHTFSAPAVFFLHRSRFVFIRCFSYSLTACFVFLLKFTPGLVFFSSKKICFIVIRCFSYSLTPCFFSLLFLAPGLSCAGGACGAGRAGH